MGTIEIMRHIPAAVFAAILIFASTSVRADVLVEIDKNTQSMTVSVDGAERWHWPVSTGRSGYDTPSGTFRAFRMEADHYSKEWDDAPMPHSIFFTKIGHAIHGSYDIKHIGAPASHGCVRLAPENAAKLYALVQQEGVLKTTVVLRGDASVARRAPRGAPAGEALTVQPGRSLYSGQSVYGGDLGYQDYRSAPPARRYPVDPSYSQNTRYQTYPGTQGYQASPAYQSAPAPGYPPFPGGSAPYQRD
jgi:L,D-transpeptidase catalytic domain